MNVRFWSLMGLGAVLAVTGLPLAASPVADARARLDAGRPAEVDEALGVLLSQPQPDVNALMVSFEAAVAAGRPYTADHRMTTLLAMHADVPPGLLLKAAQVSEWIGNTSGMLDRLAFFLQRESGSTPEVRQALATLCVAGGEARFFERYVRQFGADADTLLMGLRQLRKLREGGRASDYLRVVGLMLETWAEHEKGSAIYQEIERGIQSNVFGLTPGTLFDLASRHSIQSAAVLQGWGRRHDFSPEHALAYMENNPLERIPPSLPVRAFEMARVAEAERVGYARRLWALRPRFLDSADGANASRLLQVVSGHAALFLDSDPPMIDSGDLLNLVRHVLRKAPPEDWEHLRHWLWGLWRQEGWSITSEQRRAIALEFPAQLLSGFLREVLAGYFLEGGDAAPLRELITRSGDRIDVKTEFLNVALQLKDYSTASRTFRDVVYANPDGFSHVARAILRHQDIPAQDRIRVFQKLFLLSGYNETWKSLREEQNHPLREDPEWLAFVETIKPGTRGQDAFLALMIELLNYRERFARDQTPPAEIAGIVRRAMDAFEGSYPREGTPHLNAAFERLMNHYFHLIWDHPEAAREAVMLVLPKQGIGGAWRKLYELARRSSEAHELQTRVVNAYLASGQPYASWLADVMHPEGGSEASLSPHYAEMGIGDAFFYVQRHVSRWPQAILTREIASLTTAYSIHAFTEGQQQDVMNWVWHACASPTESEWALLDALAVPLIDRWQGSDEARLRLMQSLATVGRLEHAVPRYLSAAAKQPPATRVEAIVRLTQCLDGKPGNQPLLPVVDPEQEPSSPYDMLGVITGALADAYRGTVVPALGTVSDVQMWRLGWYRQQLANQKDDPRLQAVIAAEEQAIRALAGGAELWGDASRILSSAVRSVEAVVDRDDWMTLPSRCAVFVKCMERQSNYGEALKLAKLLSDRLLWEPLHILVDRLSPDTPEAVAEFRRLRALAVGNMPGLSPVREDDPAYPLYAAADALGRRNRERAWTLLRDHIEIFEQDPLRFPADFVAWAIEQLRIVRGEDGRLIQKASALVDQLMAQERALPSELAASLMLTRAEIARDLRRYDAARITYQAIRNHPDYRRTAAGRRALFRDVDLMVLMGNASGAEQLVDRWLTDPDPELRAQAYFVLAQIAFERGDYPETRRLLEQVFDLDFTHTEGRLLHGRWKLATRYEVDDTQVLLGDLADRTMIRPGQPLTVTVQDRNLGVAGGGESIPVRVWTSAGEDDEVLMLFPATRDPSLFRGTIETVLGPGVPGNRRLELRGDDTVFYSILPDYLASRGLISAEPKRLRVVDDAILWVSAGAIDDEDNSEMNLEQRLEAGPATRSGGRDRSNLRPGSPLYVAVRDRDRSISPGRDSVTVSVATQSGHVLNQFPLKETQPYSGIFTGVVPTRLPPPRASASDTATGFNAGDVINRSRPGHWRSQPDGRQGKWIDVDTMGSHLMARAVLQMPHPENVSALRLYGRLGDEERLMGVFPHETSGMEGGVQGQRMESSVRGATDIRRQFIYSDRLPEAMADWRVEPELNHRDQRFLFRAVMLPPQRMRVWLRIVPTTDESTPHRLHHAWVHLALNGRRLFEGGGDRLASQRIEVVLEDTPQSLEMIAAVRHESDAFRLAMEGADGTIVPLPQEWADPVEAPALKDFLASQCRIERGADGFSAVFDSPPRLRALRWVFTDYAGSDIEVRNVILEAVEGRLIVPVDRDFNDVLLGLPLAVVPGDRISVAYEDVFTTRGEGRILEQTVRSSFHDGEVAFLFEDFITTREGERRRQFHEAYRFQPGDTLVVRVEDPDMDLTPGVDAVEVRVSARSGASVVLEAIEMVEPDGERLEGGVFYALLRTVDVADARAVESAPANALPVDSDDVLTAVYLDQENTRPGIPIARTTQVRAVAPSSPNLVLYHTWRERVEDERDEARIQLSRIRRRPGNEAVERILRDVYQAQEMRHEERVGVEAIPVNLAVPLPVHVDDASQARHAGSVLWAEVATEREIHEAAAQGRTPEPILVPLSLDSRFRGIRLQSRPESLDVHAASDFPQRFSGLIRMRLASQPSHEGKDDEDPELIVTGSDRVRIRILDSKGEARTESWVNLVSSARVDLLDSTLMAERAAIHLGDRFYVCVDDPDRSVSPGQDTVEISVRVERTGFSRTLTLTETLPGSGRFSGSIRTVMEREEAHSGLDDHIPVLNGDTLVFRYRDEGHLPGRGTDVVETSGRIFAGADGRLSLFSKRFRDTEQAVYVQFRLAECLFEMAKEYRRLDQRERSERAIEEGREILETVLRDYPASGHATQGEYLLASLYKELAEERRAADDRDGARPFYEEALARFSSILATWPESDVAPRAQYHKAMCLEMLGEFERASEEYVKLTYLYPESPLVGDATVRLATYYYTEVERFDTAGRIYSNFQRRFPMHPLAPRALFMSAQCRIKQAAELWGESFGKGNPPPLVRDEYRAAVAAFGLLIETYKGVSESDLRAQSLYWMGDTSFRIGDHENAYLYLQRTVFEYPETQWARRARGMLVQESRVFGVYQ